MTASLYLPRIAQSKYSLQNLGMAEFSRRFLSDINSPVFLVPATKHYSFPKAAALLGIGVSNLIDVPVDEDARSSLTEVKKILQNCLAERKPVYTVVCVIGSTEESATDPLADVLELREELRSQGLEFSVPHRIHRHSHPDRTRHVADDRGTGGTGTLRY